MYFEREKKRPHIVVICFVTFSDYLFVSKCSIQVQFCILHWFLVRKHTVLHTSLLIFGQKISEYTFKVQQNQNFVVKNTYYSDGQNLVYKGYPHTSQMSLEKDLTFSRANGSVHFESYFSIKFNPTNSKNPWWGAYFCR